MAESEGACRRLFSHSHLTSKASERLLMQVQSSSCPPAASGWGQWHETCPQNFRSPQIRFLEESKRLHERWCDPALSSNLDGSHARARAACVTKPSPVRTSNGQPLSFARMSQPLPPVLSPRFSLRGRQG
jgi:hypothetical protein